MIGRVLNLARRPDRRRQFIDWNGGHGIRFDFVDAVDGAGQAGADLVHDGILAADAHTYSIGAIGNALSHRRLWLQAAAGAEPMLVFEDDCCLRRGFAQLLDQALAAAGEGWDIFFLGYNTNAAIAVITPEKLFGVVVFDDNALRKPGYFDKFAKGAPDAPPPYVFDTVRAWGTLGYVVTPKGAERLLDACFPLASDRGVTMHVEGRAMLPRALDGMINLALQDGRAAAKCCFPPIVCGPNDDSDVVLEPDPTGRGR